MTNQQVLDTAPVIDGDEWSTIDWQGANNRTAALSDTVKKRTVGRKVQKAMTVDEFRTMLLPAEQMDVFTMDTGSDKAEFALTGDGKMLFHFNGSEYTMRRDAYLHLSSNLGVPSDFNSKMPLELMVPIMNYQLTHHGVQQLGFGAIDHRIELFAKGELNPVSVHRVLDAVEGVLGDDGLSVRHASSDMFRTTFSIITAEEEPAFVGDVFRRGITIDSSYAMQVPLTFTSFKERLICGNGSVSIDHVFKFIHKGDGGDDMAEWMDRAIRDAIAGSLIDLDAIRGLKDVRFDGHLAEALQSVFTEFSIPKAVRDIIISKIENVATDEDTDEPFSMYSLFNIVTDVASNNDDVAADPRLVNRLMRLGGHLAANPEFCGSCHRILH